MSFDLATAAFYYMAGASVTSAILAVTRKNPVHSMLWVLALFLHVAGIFLVLHAEFLAAVQVIVYAGAILIFYLFIVMLLDLTGEETRPRFGTHWPIAVVAGIFFIIMVLAVEVEPQVAKDLSSENLAQVGKQLFGPFALPFEIVSLVLLAAIVGAVVLARKRSTES
jgi:NADH-quinone oxidoreductase subunit J